MNTAAAQAQLLTNCPHSGGQYFAEKQSIQTNTAAAQSTAVNPHATQLFFSKDNDF